ncbi:MAG: hypothetical protein ACXABY_08470, partial [Candidatus Thorarchaeota archaeon]
MPDPNNPFAGVTLTQIGDPLPDEEEDREREYAQRRMEEAQILAENLGSKGPPPIRDLKMTDDDWWNWLKATGRSFLNNAPNFPTNLWNGLTFLADPLDIAGARRFKDPKTGRPALELPGLVPGLEEKRNEAWEEFRAESGGPPVLDSFAEMVGELAGDPISIFPVLGAAGMAAGGVAAKKLVAAGMASGDVGTMGRAEAQFNKMFRPVREGEISDLPTALDSLPKTSLDKLMGVQGNYAKKISREARRRVLEDAGLRKPRKKIPTLTDTELEHVDDAELEILMILDQRVRNSNITKIEGDVGELGKWFADKFGTYGLAPPTTKQRISRAKGAIKWFEIQTKLSLRRLEDRLIPYARNKEAWDDLLEPLNKALKGDVEALAELPTEIKESVEIMGDSLRQLQLRALNSPY